LVVKLAAAGNPTVNVSPTAQNLQTIQRNLTVTGTGFGTLVLDDQNYHDNRNNPFNFPIIYALDASSVSRLYVAGIGYSGLAALRSRRPSAAAGAAVTPSTPPPPERRPP